MRRREYIIIILGGIGWPLSQQRVKIPRVGVLWHAGSAQEEALKILEIELSPFVEKELKSKYGVDWLKQVNETRANARTPLGPLPQKNGVVIWSPDNLLNLMVVHL